MLSCRVADIYSSAEFFYHTSIRSSQLASYSPHAELRILAFEWKSVLNLKAAAADRLALTKGISSPILIAKLKKSMREFLLGPSRARQIELTGTSYTDICVRFQLSPEVMMQCVDQLGHWSHFVQAMILLVRIDFQMRYWFFIIWIMLAVLVYGGYALFNGDKYYDATELEVSFDSECTNYTQAQYCGTA